MIFLYKKRKLLLTLLFSSGLFIILHSAVLAAEVGDKINFFVDQSYDSNNRTQISATLKKTSTNAYIFIEDEYWQTLDSSQQTSYMDYVSVMARDFDEKTYPALRYVFGSEWKPGIDNDEKITILLTKLKSTAGGYFNERDEYLETEVANSNEREIIYVNIIQLANPLIDSFMAHEFQHMINWNQKDRMQAIKEEVWLNELRSEYAPTAAGFDSEYSNTNLERRVDDFLANPFDSLTEWKGERFDYPSVNIFGHYLAEQFGEDIFLTMIQNNKTGIASVEQALRDKGYNLTFSEVFNNWLIASHLNSSALQDSRYVYQNPYLKGTIHVSPINYSIVSTSVINIMQSMKDWAPYWYSFLNRQDSGTITKDLEIEFEGSINSANFNVIYVVNYRSKPVVIGFLPLSGQKGVLKIPDFKTDVNSVTIIVSDQFKKSGFSSNEPSVPFTLSVATTIFQEPVAPLQPQPQPSQLPKPSDFGLKEGDLIRAQGDFDIFIINQYGYKRLFLNPAIFNMYKHLGTWKDVKTVTPTTRDAFITSDFYRFVDSPKVYDLEVTGEDTGILRWINITAENFLSQGGKSEAIFIINKSEFDWYAKGADKISL